MKTQRKNIITLIVLSLSACILSSTASAASVTWINGQTPPAAISITPTNPTAAQTVNFRIPTKMFSNSCVGQTHFGGTPKIVINHVSRTVELKFQGPAPTVCPLIWWPVSGLKGQFGPLTNGHWIFKCKNPKIAFEIPFTVGATRIIHVDKDAPSHWHTGTSWYSAYKNLQDAIAVAWSGDEIRVAQGTYYPDKGWAVDNLDKQATFELKPGVMLRGGFAGYGHLNPNAQDPNKYKTVLTGDLKDNDIWGTLHRSDNSYHVVTVSASIPTSVLEGFTITAGQAYGSYPDQYGGGLLVKKDTPVVKNCIFKENAAIFGGAVAGTGGAPALANCELTGNRALISGGAIYNNDGDLNMVNCLVTGNSAGQAAAIGSSAIYNIDGSITLSSCTIADNVAPHGKAIASVVWGSPITEKIKITNCILYNGGTEVHSNNTSIVTITYSDVKGGAAGIGNINKNPKFVKAGNRGVGGQWINGNYRLLSSSPCLGKGNRNKRPADTYDLDEDGNVIERLPVDLDKTTRVKGSQIDMGAYEGATTAPGPGPGPGPGTSWIYAGYQYVVVDVPNPPPASPVSRSYYVTNIMEINFKAQLKITIEPISAAGGNWTVQFNPDPNPVGPGTISFHFDVKGTNIDMTQLTPGTSNVKVARLKFYVQPIP